jgi:hypothetical protein
LPEAHETLHPPLGHFVESAPTFASMASSSSLPVTTMPPGPTLTAWPLGPFTSTPPGPTLTPGTSTDPCGPTWMPVPTVVDSDDFSLLQAKRAKPKMAATILFMASMRKRFATKRKGAR